MAVRTKAAHITAWSGDGSSQAGRTLRYSSSLSFSPHPSSWRLPGGQLPPHPGSGLSGSSEWCQLISRGLDFSGMNFRPAPPGLPSSSPAEMFKITLPSRSAPAKRQGGGGGNKGAIQLGNASLNFPQSHGP